jgi:(2Fe-2S) ferredoxin
LLKLAENKKMKLGDFLEKKQVLICQNRTCGKQGSAQILAAFKNSYVEGVTVVASGCLGKCGNGPMVLVLPEEIWYFRVQIDEVSVVIERHFKGGKPVKGMLYHQ